MATSVPYKNFTTPPPVPRQNRRVFAKCCFCVPIRMGCIVLGYLNLIFNTFHTMALLALTTYIGIATHGFDHFDKEPHKLSLPMSTVDSVEAPFLNQFGILLAVVLCSNIAWLVVIIACLVGIHKRQPGPIRVYIWFATIRLVITVAGFIYFTSTMFVSPETIITNTVEFGLAGYFLLVYYFYANQLEDERIRRLEKTKNIVMPAGIVFAYPTKIDKPMLTV